MAKKERLDVVLFNRGFTDSREQAQKRIMAGEVLVNDVKIDKCGTKVDLEAAIRLLGDKCPYASRGGLKLAEAFRVFPIDMEDAVVCDLGASTGGFVDCALQNGARKVYAVDVGYGQLAWALRTDERVVNMEKTNARYLEKNDFPEMINWVTTDVSFISLSKIFPAARRILAEDGQMIALIKPQFEAGKEFVGKNGVVRDPEIHECVINRCMESAQENGFYSCGITPSPIRGPKGNVEYLYWLSTKPLEIQQRILPKEVVAEGLSQP